MANNLTTVISIAIAIVCLLIIFNIVGITNKINNPATGLAVYESEEDESVNQSELAISREETSEKPAKVLDTELYSEQAYGFFYFILVILIVVIVIVGLAIILPRVKRYT